MTVLAAVARRDARRCRSAERPAVAALLALGVGGFCLVARLLGLGVLATFLSRPILTGFFIGISLSILVGQIEPRHRGRHRVRRAAAAASRAAPQGRRDPLAVARAGAGMFALLQAVRITRLPVPGRCWSSCSRCVLSALFDFRGHGIAVVGDIPIELPPLTLPRLCRPAARPDRWRSARRRSSWSASAPASSPRAASAQRGGYPVDPNRELIGFGAANIAAGLFGAFPVTASDSRTAVNLASAAARSWPASSRPRRWSRSLLFLGPALRDPPDPGARRHPGRRRHQPDRPPGAAASIWRISRIEFVFALIAHVGADRPRRAQRRRHRDRRDACLSAAQADVPARRHARPHPGPRRLLQAAPRAGGPPGARPRRSA